LLCACNTSTYKPQLAGHLSAAEQPHRAAGEIPRIVENSIALQPPRAKAKTETYSVVVNNVEVHDLLFALARDARVNIDIHPGIGGKVTLNAVDQTLPQLLTRLARQIDMRFEMHGANLSILPDTPFLHHYKVDYVNVARQVNGAVSTSTQIATAASNSGTSGGNASTGSISNTRIENTSRNNFWESLEKNVKDILRETDKNLPEGSSETQIEQANNQNSTGMPPLAINGKGKSAQTIANVLQNSNGLEASSHTNANTTVRRNTFREAASVIVNTESGIVTVRATQKQHDRIQEFIDQVSESARRQVMIEATIVEVELSEGHKQGIDWSRFRADNSGFSVSSPSNGTVSDTGGTAFNLIFNQFASPLNLVAAINLLQSFGTTKVLSSPRLSMLNNQTSLLKVVENIVYFSVKSDTTTSATVGTTTAVTTTPQSVSVGLVMAVTAQISDSNNVILNIRPSISSVSDWKQDPNPANKVANFVPQIRTREIESVMSVASGDMAVLGGLMEDRIDLNTGRVPILGQIPVAGELLTKRDNASRKSELVIFLRPVVLSDASLNGDLAPLAKRLPDQHFFTPPVEASPLHLGGRP
jgi:general secretion pathway protein D